MSPRNSRHIPTSSGVYQIRYNQNGKIYIGSAVNLQWRWRSHRRDLGNGVHVNPHLQSAWNLYGETSFEFSVLQYVEEHRLLASEQLWIDKTGGEPGTAFVTLGNTHMTAVPVAESRHIGDGPMCAAGRNWGLWCIRDSSPLAVQW
jgi:GIY-YIG catalytic domain